MVITICNLLRKNTSFCMVYINWCLSCQKLWTLHKSVERVFFREIVEKFGWNHRLDYISYGESSVGISCWPGLSGRRGDRLGSLRDWLKGVKPRWFLWSDMGFLMGVIVINVITLIISGVIVGTLLFTRWWFQRFFMFIPTWGNDPIWLIFFKWVETTN